MQLLGNISADKDLIHKDYVEALMNELSVPTALPNPYSLSWTINGSSDQYTGATSKYMQSIYAPTTAGTAGYYLKSSGTGAPVWDKIRSIGVNNVRDEERLPSYYDSMSVTAWFNNKGTPIAGWHAGLNVQGWTNETYAAWQIAGCATQGMPDDTFHLYWRNGCGDEWNGWRTILDSANYTLFALAKDGNAVSATKLATSRKIWGKDFNGTSDIDGTFSIDGYGALHRASGNLWINYAGSNAGYSTYICGNSTILYSGLGSQYNVRLTLNEFGGITIGGSNYAGDPADGGYRLYVDGNTLVKSTVSVSALPTLGSKPSAALFVGSTSYGLSVYTTGDGYSVIQNGRYDGTATAYSLRLNPLGGYVSIGGAPNSEYLLTVHGKVNTKDLVVSGTLRNTSAVYLRGAVQETYSASNGAAMAYGSHAYGNQSTALGVYSFAGLRTGDSTYPYAYMKEHTTLAMTVDGATVYGAMIAPAGTLTYTYNGTEHTVTNPNSSYHTAAVLINGGDDLMASGNYPWHRVALMNDSSIPLGRGSYILRVTEIETGIYELLIYTWSQASFSFPMNSACKCLAWARVTSGDYTGSYSVASGSYSVASGYSSVASGSSSVASGYYSVASGYSSVASGSYSVASGYYSVASGYYSVAKYNYSYALGRYTTTGTVDQTVIGRYNEDDNESIFVIGAGASDAPRNCFTVDLYGNIKSYNTGSVIQITLDRAAAGWRMRNESGILKFQCDWTDSKGDYYNAFTLNYNTKNATFYGNAAFEQNVNVTGNLTVTGNVTISGELTNRQQLEILYQDGSWTYDPMRRDDTDSSVWVRSIGFLNGEGVKPTVTYTNTAEAQGFLEIQCNLVAATTAKLGGIKAALEAVYKPKIQTSALNIVADSLGTQYYGVEIAPDGTAFVYVPWENAVAYPTSWEWTAGTTDGATATLSGTGMDAVSIPALPAASSTASGIVTTGAQTFAGAKTFSSVTARAVFLPDIMAAPMYGLMADNSYYSLVGLDYITSPNSAAIAFGQYAIHNDLPTYIYGKTVHLFYLSTAGTVTAGLNIAQTGTVTVKALTQSSDMRLKSLAGNISLTIDDIAAAPIFDFRYTDDPDTLYSGSSAQYWQTILPNTVKAGLNDYLAMDYGGIALVSVVAVARKTVELEKRIAELEQEIETLKS